MSGQHAEFAEGEDPDDFWKLLLAVLKTMTEKERREHIDAELVKELDEHVRTKNSRALYGKKGRNVGESRSDLDQTDEDEEDEDEE